MMFSEFQFDEQNEATFITMHSFDKLIDLESQGDVSPNFVKTPMADVSPSFGKVDLPRDFVDIGFNSPGCNRKRSTSTEAEDDCFLVLNPTEVLHPVTTPNIKRLETH